MPISKEILKFIYKITDNSINTNLYPKLLSKNSIYSKNDYKISDDYSYVFVHVPKTAGYTMNDVIHKINRLNGKKILRGGHNPVSILHSPENKNYFTVLRHPVERVYSYYKYSLADKKQVYYYLAKKGLKVFLKNCPEAQNAYCQYYTGNLNKKINNSIFEEAVNNLKNFKDILLFESLGNEIKSFAKKFNLEIDIIPHLNERKTTQISEEDIKLVSFYNDYDIKLYEIFSKKNN